MERLNYTEKNKLVQSPSDSTENSLSTTNSDINISSTESSVSVGIETAYDDVTAMQPMSFRSVQLQRGGFSYSGKKLCQPSGSEEDTTATNNRGATEVSIGKNREYLLCNEYFSSQEILYQRNKAIKMTTPDKESPSTSYPRNEDNGVMLHIHGALLRGAYGELAIMLQQNASTISNIKFEDPLLKSAISFRDKDVATKMAMSLIEYNVDLNFKLTGKQSMLYHAVYRNLIPVTKALLKKGMDVNAGKCKEEGNPLYRAIKNENFKCISLLFSYKADVDGFDTPQTSLIRYATFFNNATTILVHLVLNGVKVLPEEEEMYKSLLAKNQLNDPRSNAFKLNSLCLRKVYSLCDRTDSVKETNVNIAALCGKIPREMLEILETGLFSPQFFQ